MSSGFPGLKLIRHNAANVNLLDDPSFPFKLEAEFSAPEFMVVGFAMMHGGSENILVRGMTKELLDEFVKKNDLRVHPRLLQLTITGPDGIVEQIPKK